MKALRTILVFIIILLLTGIATIANASSLPLRAGELSDLAADGLSSTVDVQIFESNFLHQYDHLLYEISNREVYAGKRINDPTRVVLSLGADVIYNSRIHTNDHRLYKILGNHILPPSSESISESLYSIDGDKFYRGSQTNLESNRIFTRRENKIYKGTSNDLGDVVLSFEGDYEELQPFLVIIADLRP